MAREGEIPLFPPPTDSSGLVGLGGKLTPDWVLAAYAQGVFPWPIVEGRLEQLAWFSPDPRAILPMDDYHVPRRLARRLRRGEFELRWNTNFPQVLESCAAPRSDENGVWLTAAMQRAYEKLHALGHAHSAEVWQGETLAAGILGVSLGGLFSAESMFHCVSDAGSAAIALLVADLRQRGYGVLDIQQTSDHMDRRGAIEIPRELYLKQLAAALPLEPAPPTRPSTQPPATGATNISSSPSRNG